MSTFSSWWWLPGFLMRLVWLFIALRHLRWVLPRRGLGYLFCISFLIFRLFFGIIFKGKERLRKPVHAKTWYLFSCRSSWISDVFIFIFATFSIYFLLLNVFLFRSPLQWYLIHDIWINYLLHIHEHCLISCLLTFIRLFLLEFDVWY